MRWILRLVLLSGVIFTGLWALARHQLGVAVDQFLAEAAQQGGSGQASLGLSPAALDLTIRDLVLVDPQTGMQAQSPVVRISAPTWRPWQLTATAEGGDVTAAERLTWRANPAKVVVALTPGTDLALHDARIEGQEWQLSSDAGWAGRLASLTVSFTALDSPALYQLDAKAWNLALDPAYDARLAGTGLSNPIDQLYVDAQLGFAAPLDRHLGPAGPQITQIDLRRAELTWANAFISAQGRLVADPQGFAEGEMTLQIIRWQELIAAAVVLGVLPADQAGFLQKGLTPLVDPADPSVVNVTFTATGGMIRLGPFPLGPAPRLNSLQRQ